MIFFLNGSEYKLARYLAVRSASYEITPKSYTEWDFYWLLNVGIICIFRAQRGRPGNAASFFERERRNMFSFYLQKRIVWNKWMSFLYMHIARIGVEPQGFYSESDGFQDVIVYSIQ